MRSGNYSEKWPAGIKVLASMAAFWVVVLLVNYPTLSFDMMYYEQPILYLANQKIASFADLMQVYWHPNVLEAVNIPFFRPSGHFLVYQLITAFLGWHNTRAFLAVNFLFLALSCYVITRIYALLFPHFRVGGYIACGLYLMHPALMLSRLTPMHFEFASVLFVLLGLYGFMVFCQRTVAGRPAANDLLALALFCYFVSITFKESGLMLGPVMALYLCIAHYDRRPFHVYVVALLRQADRRKVLALLTVTTLTFAMYLSLMWRSFLPYQFQTQTLPSQMSGAFVKCMKMLFGFVSSSAGGTHEQATVLVWDMMIYPGVVRGLLWLLSGVTIWSTWRLLVLKRRQNAGDVFETQKAFLFLLLAALAFLLMPVVWGRARPWHLALSLVFVCQMMGFGLEYACQILSKTVFRRRLVGIGVAVISGALTLLVASENIHFIERGDSGFTLRLNRNAVLFPPDLVRSLNADSVVVVEDSLLHNDYLLGDSAYPDALYGSEVVIQHLLPIKGFYQFPQTYGGTLFRWAYLLPGLQEEVYPFQIDQMRTVSSITIYHWLQHRDNIFCLGYDRQAAWHDRTFAFKKQLLVEQTRRHLVVNPYRVTTVNSLPLGAGKIMRPPLRDATYCQLYCDADKHCTGFAYADKIFKGLPVKECIFSMGEKAGVAEVCHSCQYFLKG